MSIIEQVKNATGQQYNNFTSGTIIALSIFLGLFHIYYNTVGSISENHLTAVHYGGFGALCALLYPSVKAHSPMASRWPMIARWVVCWDVFIACLVMACCIYLIFFESDLYQRGVVFNAQDWLFSAIAVVSAIELSRRALGWLIPVLIVVTLSYVCWWGEMLQGLFAFPGLSLETLLFRSYFSSEGMFGNIAYISATYVFMFILFGAFLLHWGAGNFLIDIARSTAGKQAGGAGVVAVVASGMMGSVSGSAVANTCSTGVITIPIMKRVGFSPRFAAAIEAGASTGGQLMPPVMGAGIFILASYTQVPYLDIVAISILPAILYFLSIIFFVRIEARKLGLSAEDDAPSFRQTFQRGWYFLVPLVVLVIMLLQGFTPTYSAGIGILTIVVLSWFTSRPMGVTDIMISLVQGAKNMVTTAVLLVAIGLVVNVISTVGIGNAVSLMIGEWAQGSLLLALIYVALASLVLGMGLPVTASYIVLGTLSAPLIYELLVQNHLVALLSSGQIPDAVKSTLMLVSPDNLAVISSPIDPGIAKELVSSIPAELMPILIEQSVDPVLLSSLLLTAHLIIFWLSQDSNVTPPVCLTAYSAAAIAGSQPMATGFTAWKVAKALYIIPLLFAYTPLVSGDWSLSFYVFFISAFGLYALTGAMQGYLHGPVTVFNRILLLMAAMFCLWPHEQMLLGFLACVAVTILALWSRYQSIARASSA